MVYPAHGGDYSYVTGMYIFPWFRHILNESYVSKRAFDFTNNWPEFNSVAFRFYAWHPDQSWRIR